ncbi:MAG: hypothetical protein LM568_04020 [Desulfurococcaceae archaeon]|nr:hypothetical protein [Desulfurococcaceae archaeon]
MCISTSQYYPLTRLDVYSFSLLLNVRIYISLLAGRVLGEDVVEQSFKVFLEVFEEVY